MKEKKKKEKKKITVFSDFKRFILRGNILDLAVAVIIGGAFGKIVTSLVNDIIMPLISLALGGISFSDIKWVIREADEAKGITETSMNFGNFIQTTIDFLIIAVCIFLVIRIVGNLSRKINQLGDAMKNKVGKEGGDESATVEQPAQSDEATPAAEVAAPSKPTQEELLTEIRDLLRERKS